MHLPDTCIYKNHLELVLLDDHGSWSESLLSYSVWAEVMLYEIMEWVMGKVWGFCKDVFHATFLDSVSRQ